MSVLTLDYPPVLTPRVIAGLNGRLPDDAREQLIALARQSIQQCFLPFSRRPPSEKTYTAAVTSLVPHRQWLLERLFSLLPADDVTRVLGEAIKALRAMKGWEVIGLPSPRIAKLIDRVGKASNRLLSSAPQLRAWGSAVTPALKRLIDSSVWVATEVDFVVMALALCREGELSLSARQLKFLVKGAPSLLKRYELHVATG